MEEGHRQAEREAVEQERGRALREEVGAKSAEMRKKAQPQAATHGIDKQLDRIASEQNVHAEGGAGPVRDALEKHRPEMTLSAIEGNRKREWDESLARGDAGTEGSGEPKGAVTTTSEKGPGERGLATRVKGIGPAKPQAAEQSLVPAGKGPEGSKALLAAAAAEHAGRRMLERSRPPEPAGRALEGRAVQARLTEKPKMEELAARTPKRAGEGSQPALTIGANNSRGTFATPARATHRIAPPQRLGKPASAAELARRREEMRTAQRESGYGPQREVE